MFVRRTLAQKTLDEGPKNRGYIPRDMFPCRKLYNTACCKRPEPEQQSRESRRACFIISSNELALKSVVTRAYEHRHCARSVTRHSPRETICPTDMQRKYDNLRRNDTLPFLSSFIIFKELRNADFPKPVEITSPHYARVT